MLRGTAERRSFSVWETHTSLMTGEPLSGTLCMVFAIGFVRQEVCETNVYSLAFFDKHLKGLAAPLLDGPSPDYPEVVFMSRHP